jgi:hypothetical protein
MQAGHACTRQLGEPHQAGVCGQAQAWKAALHTGKSFHVNNFMTMQMYDGFDGPAIQGMPRCLPLTALYLKEEPCRVCRFRSMQTNRS